MRLLLDENEDPAILDPLRAAFRQHDFRSADDEGLRHVDDPELFEAIAERGFEAIITRDNNQLKTPDERCKLRDARLHWIGHREPKATGLVLRSTTAAAYLAAMPHIFEVLRDETSPLAFYVRNIGSESAQRVKVRPI